MRGLEIEEKNMEIASKGQEVDSAKKEIEVLFLKGEMPMQKFRD